MDGRYSEMPVERPASPAMRVLLVDDEPGVLNALMRLFTRVGAEVRTAASAEAALAILDEFAPDAVVSDHRMAGMTGVELLRVIGGRFPAARRVLLSGYVDIDVGDDVVFMAKPYVAAELLAACR